jgi:hypothetical protein
VMRCHPWTAAVPAPNVPGTSVLALAATTMASDATAMRTCHSHQVACRLRANATAMIASAIRMNACHGAAATAAAGSEVASWSVSSRAIGRSSAEWYGASPSSTPGRVDAATPTPPMGTSMASKC